MPNQEALERVAARRKARESAKGAAKAMADTEAQEIAKLTQKQNEDRASGKTANTPNSASAKSISKAKAQSRAEKREAAAKAAERQAEEDVRVMPEKPSEETIQSYLERGETPPLHLLNALAKKADVALKDEARTMANAVGKVAFEQAMGRGERNRHTRMKRMNDAIKRQREVEATETK